MELRPYQKEIAEKGISILRQFKILYLALEVRTGKTITSLEICAKSGLKNVLFVTKKKAIQSIVNDAKYYPDLNVTVINYESVAKVNNYLPDVVICDEAHSLGAYPLSAKRVKDLKPYTKGKPIIYLSGTPSPESYSQLYHQFYISSYSPFREPTFYKWAKNYVQIRKKYIYNREIYDYSQADEAKIGKAVNHLFINFTQAQAGIEKRITEKILFVDMEPAQAQAIEILKRDRILKTKSGDAILADTNVKLQSKIHQICSGSCIGESGESHFITDAKAKAVKSHFSTKKIAIFYKFKAEADILKQTFPDWTDSPEAFQENGGTFLGQFVSSREGIRLDSADAIVFYNIDFSFLSYEQARNRIVSKERSKEAVLFWVFTRGGIEEKIYKVVKNKKDYTNYWFKKDYL